MTPTFASLALRGCFLWAKMQAQRTNVLPGGSGRLSQVLRASRFVESTAAHRNSGFSQHSGFIDDFRKIPNLSRSLFGFMRPHTIYGTLISIVSISLMAASVDSSPYNTLLWKLWQVIFCALAMNVTIVGLNQIYDKKMDKINKPYLPLVSGGFTTDTALTTIAVCCSSSVICGTLTQSFHLLTTLVLSLLLGVIYSTDFKLLRWKRIPALAIVCILSVRAILVQWGFFGHFMSSSYIPYWAMPENLAFSILFMSVYSVVIALLKDTPDLVGDSQSGMRTLAVRLGVKPVLRLCCLLLFLAYSSGILVGLSRSDSCIQMIVLTLGHSLSLILIFIKYSKTEHASSSSLYSFYMFIWKMFYCEYFMLPFL